MPSQTLRRGSGPHVRAGVRRGFVWAGRVKVEIREPSPVSVPSESSPDRAGWREVARVVLLSRALDEFEMRELYETKRVAYQFSARGHELSQALVGRLLTGPMDAATVYYRSRPFLHALGLDLEDALAAVLGRSGSFSDGRDTGAVYNLPRRGGPTVLPMAGDVGAQFTPAAGWCQALRYRAGRLGDAAAAGCIGVAHGGEGAAATGGFWSALTMATTLRLPMLFFIEDNGYAISVPGRLQTPGGNLADNLRSFQGLRILEADGCDPAAAATAAARAVAHVRAWDEGPCLLRMSVPRLCGHSGQDNQQYRPPGELEAEMSRDPVARLRAFCVPGILTAAEWDALAAEQAGAVRDALARAEARPDPDPEGVRRHLFQESTELGAPIPAVRGGLLPEGAIPDAPAGTEPETVRTTMLAAIRRTLESELRADPRVLVFGEDIGRKGGVHGVTAGLQERFGEERVFDTSLSEEGIVGRAAGMAAAGLMPVAEIQFRKYADAAQEQLHNAGTVRWRTANRCASPIVVRIPVGFSRQTDPCHSESAEAAFVRMPGWRVAFPSQADDAAGLLRAAIRGHAPVFFLEHRALLDGVGARRPYPGDGHLVPFGRARTVREGRRLTVVTWGAMVERSVLAAAEAEVDAEILDLRTLAPWDEEAVLDSVGRTRRCLIVHEDLIATGFGAEIAAVVAERAFTSLDAPVARVASEPVPVPYHPALVEAVIPGISRIARRMRELSVF